MMMMRRWRRRERVFTVHGTCKKYILMILMIMIMKRWRSRKRVFSELFTVHGACKIIHDDDEELPRRRWRRRERVFMERENKQFSRERSEKPPLGRVNI